MWRTNYERGLVVLDCTRGVVVAVLAGMIVVGCSSGSDTSVPTEALTSTLIPTLASPTTIVVAPPTSTVTTAGITTTNPPTTTEPAPTTVPPPTTTTTMIYFTATPSFYPPPSMSSNGASGSGCSPGAGTLPNGVWFGYITAGDATSLEFDLACWYFGDLAWEVADTYGDTAENDYYIVNQNPTPRTVPVATGAIAHHIDQMSIGHDPQPYPDWLFEPPGYLDCPFGFCPLWLYVNDGAVTEILEQYVP